MKRGKKEMQNLRLGECKLKPPEMETPRREKKRTFSFLLRLCPFPALLEGNLAENTTEKKKKDANRRIRGFFFKKGTWGVSLCSYDRGRVRVLAYHPHHIA